MVEIAGVRFLRSGRVFYFNPGSLHLEVNDIVVMAEGEGLHLGRVIVAPQQVIYEALSGPLPLLLRKATPNDLATLERPGATSTLEHQ